MSSLERLQKVLAAAGVDSRRHCEALIQAGRVSVDGVVVTEQGVKVDVERQVVCLDGERIRIRKREYYLFHKPKGVLCTNFDPAGRPRVIDFFPQEGPRLFTVGRLDENSEGLLLVTNDGELAQKLLHPRFQTPRVYRALVAGDPTLDTLQHLKDGLYFTEGKFRVHDVRKVAAKGQSAILKVTLLEGQNREVRRLLARVGHKVLALRRVSFGPLKLEKLAAAESRRLTKPEVEELMAFADGKRRSPRGEPRTTRRPSGSSRPKSPPAAGVESTGAHVASHTPERRAAAMHPPAPRLRRVSELQQKSAESTPTPPQRGKRTGGENRKAAGRPPARTGSERSRSNYAAEDDSTFERPPMGGRPVFPGAKKKKSPPPTGDRKPGKRVAQRPSGPKPKRRRPGA